MQWGVGGSMPSKIVSDETKTYKARYVAKGYNQVMGVDYKETFSPTANLTLIRALMQVAAHDLNVHQMDVKTAYLHALSIVNCILNNPKVLSNAQTLVKNSCVN